MSRLQATLAAIVATQAAHSVEEYLGRLYEIFPAARVVSGFLSPNLEQGFVIFNVALVSFGVWCVLWPVRRKWRSAAAFMWVWVAIELINGVGHPVWSLMSLAYTPGVATAPLLLGLALYLGRQLRAVARTQSAAA